MLNENEYKNTKVQLVCVALLALAHSLCIALFISSPMDHVYSDMEGYISKALRIASGGPFTEFDTFFPLGYSYYCALFFLLFGESWGFVFLTFSQLLLFASSAVVLTWLSSQLCRDTRLGFLSGLIFAASYPVAIYCGFFMAEILFTFLLFSSLALLLRLEHGNKRLALYAGFATGMLALVKTQGLVVLLCFWSVRNRTTWIWGLICISLAFVAVGLVLLANHLLLVYNFGLSSENVFAGNSWFNFFLAQSRRSAAGALSPLDGTFYVFANNNSGLEYLFHPPKVFLGSILDQALFKPEVLKLWSAQPMQQLIAGLQSIAELLSFKVCWPPRNLSASVPLLAASQSVYLVVFAGPALSVLFADRNEAVSQRLFAYCLLPTAALVFSAFFFSGQPRYLVPFYGLMIPPALWFYATALRACGKPSMQKHFGTLCGKTALLILSITGLLMYSSHLYETSFQSKPAQTSFSPSLTMLEAPPQGNLTPLLVVELGKGENHLYPSKPALGYAVQLRGFNHAVHDNQFFCLEGQETGAVSFVFPTNQASYIGLFVSDLSAGSRITALRSAGEIVLAQELSERGRWFYFAINEAEKAEGNKVLELQKIWGDSLQISAAAIF